VADAEVATDLRELRLGAYFRIADVGATTTSCKC
jgi:hypothetical protein